MINHESETFTIQGGEGVSKPIPIAKPVTSNEELNLIKKALNSGMLAPCITLRENTEWMETLHGGWNVLVGADKNRIVKAVLKPYPDSLQPDIFGTTGVVCKNILNILGGI